MTCGPEPDDFYITEEGTCSGYRASLDFDDLRHFVVEESGVQPGTPDGPVLMLALPHRAGKELSKAAAQHQKTVHWARGYIVCPNCGVQLPYEASS